MTSRANICICNAICADTDLEQICTHCFVLCRDAYVLLCVSATDLMHKSTFIAFGSPTLRLDHYSSVRNKVQYLRYFLLGDATADEVVEQYSAKSGEYYARIRSPNAL